MDDLATPGGARRRADGLQRREFQDVAGVDGIGVADQRFDLGDGQPFRAPVERRHRRRAPDALRWAFGPVERGGKAGPWRGAGTQGFGLAGADHRQQALQPARGDGRGAAGLQGPRQDDFALPQPLRHVMGGQPRAALRRFQPQSGLHRPRQPRVGGIGLRPDALIEAAENEPVHPLQAGFQRPQMWMRVSVPPSRRTDWLPTRARKAGA